MLIHVSSKCGVPCVVLLDAFLFILLSVDLDICPEGTTDFELKQDGEEEKHYFVTF